MIPYEIHVTVEVGGGNIPQFVEACRSVEVKPIVLELQLESSTLQDVMTSSKHVGTDHSVMEEVDRIVSGLGSRGFNSIRTKVETAPRHPLAPKQSGMLPVDRYFEAHLAVTIQPDCIPALRDIVLGYAHLSQNAFKKGQHGTVVMMATIRDHDKGSIDFIDHVNEVCTMMQSNGFVVDPPIIEFALYDSKVQHDALWING